MVNLDKLLQMKSDIEKLFDKMDKEAQGYEPRCKICNCPYQDEIEEMYEEKHSYRVISDFLYSKGYDTSYMSLSRHFNKHYPKKKAYQEKIRNMQDEAVQNAMDKYPILRREFENEELSCAGVFLNKHGYCLDGKRFCDNVPKKEVSIMVDVIMDIEYILLEMSDFPHLYKYEKKLFKMLKCLECRSLENNVILDYLIHAFTENVLGLDIEPEKFREMFWYDAEWDFEEMDKLLDQLKGRLSNSKY